MVYHVEAADHEGYAESEAEPKRLLALEAFEVHLFVLRNKNDHYNDVSEKERRAVGASGHHKGGRDSVRRL